MHFNYEVVQEGVLYSRASSPVTPTNDPVKEAGRLAFSFYQVREVWPREVK